MSNLVPLAVNARQSKICPYKQQNILDVGPCHSLELFAGGIDQFLVQQQIHHVSNVEQLIVKVYQGLEDALSTLGVIRNTGEAVNNQTN